MMCDDENKPILTKEQIESIHKITGQHPAPLPTKITLRVLADPGNKKVTLDFGGVSASCLSFDVGIASEVVADIQQAIESIRAHQILK